MVFETNARLELRDRANGLSAQLSGRAPEDVLRTVIREIFPGRVGLVSSFGTEAAVLLHMVAQIDPYTPVVFLETHKHFPETLDYRMTLAKTLGLCNLQQVSPRPASIAADDPNGLLHRTNPDLCCHVRKTLPMLKALRGLDCWITGRKRYQAATRTALDLFEVQDRWIKVNPIMEWGRDDIDAYFGTHDLPRHPLEAQGYPSVGCAPCTAPVQAGDDPRAGRWANSGKTECGIHFENGRPVRSAAGKK